MSSLSSLTTKELENFNLVESDQWAIEGIPNFDTSTSQFEWYSISPSIPVDGQTLAAVQSTVNFKIRENDRYILPSKFYLQLQFSVTKANANHVVAPVNPMSHCLFRGCRYEINGTMIEEYNDYITQRALAEIFTKYDRNFIASTADTLGWGLDSPGVGANINKYNITTTNTVVNTFSPLADTDDGAADPNNDGPLISLGALVNAGTEWNDAVTNDDDAERGAARVSYNAAVTQHNGNAIYALTSLLTGSNLGNTRTTVSDLATYNAGLAQRYAIRTSVGAVDTYNLRVPIKHYFSFCDDIKTVFRGYVHDINFTFNKDVNSILHRVDGADLTAAAIRIKKLRLWIAVVKPSPTTDLKLQTLYKKFSESPEPKPIQYFPYRVFYHRENVASLRWKVGNLLNRPVLMYFFMTDPPKAAQNGDSPNVFKHRNITKLSLEVDTYRFPDHGYTCNFDAGEEDYVRAYQYFLEVSAINDIPYSSPITYKEFKNNYPFFCFDLSTVDEAVFAGARNYVINAEMTAADTQFYAMFVYQQIGYMSLEAESIRIFPKS